MHDLTGKSAHKLIHNISKYSPVVADWLGFLLDASLDSSDEATIRETFSYPTGYPLQASDPVYTTIHEIRKSESTEIFTDS